MVHAPWGTIYIVDNIDMPAAPGKKIIKQFIVYATA
jgi:hypothetical protein